jgi:hypothetical protein
MKAQNICSISDISDIKAIEAHPYDQFMPHTNVFTALEGVALSHPQRHAITYIQDATDKSASQT